MTPRERAAALVGAQGDELSRYQRMFLAQDIEKEIQEAIDAELSTLRAAADQAISNLRAIVALNDDPHIEEIANVTADLLGKVLVDTAALRALEGVVQDDN
jgi:hypothetical protein